jgi:uncharacterized membrane protein YphA (DoxX/SURF4 family)
LKLQRTLILLSSLLFLIYGVLCIGTQSMVHDFQRFGLPHLRILTGVLELLGALGLLLGLQPGYKWLWSLRISAAGLALLMLIAFAIRMRAHDGVAVSIPSFTLMLVNAWIFARSFKT